jgi:hypothetical protein
VIGPIVYGVEHTRLALFLFGAVCLMAYSRKRSRKRARGGLKELK